MFPRPRLARIFHTGDEAPPSRGPRELGRALALAALVLSSLRAQEDPAFARVKHLQHGVNLAGWFSQASNYQPERLRSFLNLDDIDLIKRMGFDHVRIPVDPGIFCRGPWDGCEAVKILDGVVAHAVAQGLAVQIDIHPSSDFKRELASSEDAVERFSQLWGRLAGHYARTDPNLVFFEIMNEPESADPYRWAAIEERILPEIRRHAPDHTVIVSGTHYSKVEDLIQLPRFAESNLIFNFHYYDPHLFTHQGATWGPAFWARLRDLPFPSSPEKVAPLVNREPDDYTRFQLLRYGLEHWDEARLAAEIGFAADWAKARGVPLICNEFGAYRRFSQPEDRVRFLTAIRTAFAQNHIGWTMWDYHTGFGVVTREDGRTVVDRKVLQALGLAEN